MSAAPPPDGVDRKAAFLIAGLVGCGALSLCGLFGAGVVAGVVHKGLQRPSAVRVPVLEAEPDPESCCCVTVDGGTERFSWRTRRECLEQDEGMCTQTTACEPRF